MLNFIYWLLENIVFVVCIEYKKDFLFVGSIEETKIQSLFIIVLYTETARATLLIIGTVHPKKYLLRRPYQKIRVILDLNSICIVSYDDSVSRAWIIEIRDILKDTLKRALPWFWFKKILVRRYKTSNNFDILRFNVIVLGLKFNILCLSQKVQILFHLNLFSWMKVLNDYRLP